MTAYLSLIFAILTDPSVLAAICLIGAVAGFRHSLRLLPSGRHCRASAPSPTPHSHS